MIDKPLNFEDYTILVIDDNPDSLKILVDFLELYGFNMVLANSGDAGVKQAKVIYPDLILLDVMMPGMNGFETCCQLKAYKSLEDIPVVFMTALDNIEDKVRGFEVGAVDYVTKPIEHKELLARITTHLRIRDLTTQLNTKIEELTKTHQTLTQKVEELTKTRHELVQSEKMASLGRLVASFAHELNTPIGIAVGSASTLKKKSCVINQLLEQDEVDEEELVTTLSKIDEAADLTLSNLKRAARLIESFKRTAIDQTSEHLRKFEVKTTIEDVINTLRNKFKRTSIEIQLDCSDNLTVCSTPGLLEQILTNLMMNSLIHGFEEGKNGGYIKIVVRLEEQRLLINYSDTGKGIASDALEKIFEPFFTTYRAHGGSGLGMYICYNLVTSKLNGTMTCESTPGNGVLFKIEFPVEF